LWIVILFKKMRGNMKDRVKAEEQKVGTLHHFPQSYGLNINKINEPNLLIWFLTISLLLNIIAIFINNTLRILN
jgi:hypothetical protein